MVEVGNFKFIETKIPDLYIVEPKVFGDARGYFMESYNKEHFDKASSERFQRSKQYQYPLERAQLS